VETAEVLEEYKMIVDKFIDFKKMKERAVTKCWQCSGTGKLQRSKKDYTSLGVGLVLLTSLCFSGMFSDIPIYKLLGLIGFLICTYIFFEYHYYKKQHDI
jgi:hypothetical protein